MNYVLDVKHMISYDMGHEQAARRKARPNPLDAGRGVLHALDLPRGRGLDQYRGQAPAGRRGCLRGLPRPRCARRARFQSPV